MISRKVTGALAWTGLVIVIAVPSADALLSRFAPASSSVIEPAAPVVVKPTPAKPAPKPVATVSPAPKPVVAPTPMPAPAVTEASAPATIVAEQPADVPAAPADPVGDYLSSNKTLPSYITSSGKPAASAATPTPAPSATPVASTGDAAPLLDEDKVAPAAAVPAAPKPVTPAKPKPQTVRPITEADLKGWKSGTLEDYLRQNGLLSTGSDTGTAN